MKSNLKFIVAATAVFVGLLWVNGFDYALAATAPIATAPVAQAAPDGIVQCGRGANMCTLCDLIKGLNDVIQFIMRISIGVALLTFTIGGLMYAISAGDTGAIGNAKAVMKNAAIGFVLVFTAFLIVNTTIDYVGSKKTNGQSTFGMNITSWGKFDCNAGIR